MSRARPHPRAAHIARAVRYFYVRRRPIIMAVATRRKRPPANPPPPAPASSTKPTERPRNAFLGPVDINRQGTTRLKLTGVLRIYTGDRGVSLICEVIVGSAKGAHRDYSVMIGKRSFIAMQNKLGRDLGQWAGQTIDVVCDSTGQYVNVYDPEAPPASTVPASSHAGANGPAPPDDDDIPF